MKASVRWISNFLTSLLPTDQIIETLTRIGHEVDEAITVGEIPDSVVVGLVLEVSKHPDADRLRVCKVDVGEGPDNASQIICGAPNVAVGQFVAVAVPGTTLPLLDKNGNPLTIVKAKIRGIESNGMICAEDELGLGEDHSGIMVLNDKASIELLGQPLSSVLSLQADTILDIGLTPNRPDAASHSGLARDLSAATGILFKSPFSSDLSSEYFTNTDGTVDSNHLTTNFDGINIPQVDIRAKQACPRYAGVVVCGVNVSESPDWLRTRLESLGLRSVNNVVDITNEVLHEIGQPLHAFDLDTFTSDRVTIQSFDKPISFTTLDHVKREYPAGSLFICDGDTPVALAGIMGGESSEVSNKTTSIFLESAYFEPSGIRKTAKAAGLQTDASYRYERGIDPNMALNAAIYAAKKITEVAGGQIHFRIQDIQTEFIPAKKTLTFRPERAELILGTQLDSQFIRDLFLRLDIRIVHEKDSQWECEIPTFRPDITREVDLIEEVGRLIDYNMLPVPAVQRAFVPAPIPKWEEFKDRIRALVSALQYREIVTNSLLSSQAVLAFANPNEIIHTLNPVSQDAVSLRSSLLAGFTQAVRFNANREAESMKFFEIGQIYARTNKKGDWVDGVRERTHLQLGVAGNRLSENWRSKATAFTLFDLKEDLTALLNALGLYSGTSYQPNRDSLLDEEVLILQIADTTIGKIVPFSKTIQKKLNLELPLFAAELDLNACFDLLNEKTTRPIRFREPSKFPPFSFDAAFVVDKQTAVQSMTEVIQHVAGSRLQDISVFDLYEGESIGNDKKSVAFRMSFLDRTKTLSSSDVEPVIQKIVDQLGSRFSAVLRS